MREPCAPNFSSDTAASLPRRPARQKWAICLWYAQVVALVAMLATVIFFDVETIVVTGPTLSIIGVALSLAARPLVARSVLFFSLSAPLICALGALVIAFFELSPDDAYAPILIMISCYALLISPIAIRARRTIRAWPAMSQTRWLLRYNMKSLFVLMTGVCVAAAVLSYLANAALGFPIVFGTFAIIAAALPVLIAWRFRADRRGSVEPSAGDSAVDYLQAE